MSCQECGRPGIAYRVPAGSWCRECRPAYTVADPWRSVPCDVCRSPGARLTTGANRCADHIERLPAAVIDGHHQPAPARA